MKHFAYFFEPSLVEDLNDDDEQAPYGCSCPRPCLGFMDDEFSEHPSHENGHEEADRIPCLRDSLNLFDVFESLLLYIKPMLLCGLYLFELFCSGGHSSIFSVRCFSGKLSGGHWQWFAESGRHHASEG